MHDSQVAEHKNLTLKAKGLWLYLRTRPDGWKLSSERIAADTKDGRDAVRGAIHELEDAGLLEITTKSNGRGFETTYKLNGGEKQ